jgi:O-antigen ligase/polysaccharide polymerase Wzy-like membrane protein
MTSTATAPRSGTTTARGRLTWPLTVSFGAYPVWWVLGVGAFVWPVVACCMLVSMVWRRWSRAPAVMLIWLAFLAWVLLTAAQLSSGTRLMTFLYRYSLYAGGAVLFLYVYNLPRSRRLEAKVLNRLLAFWVIVVVGGYAGIAFGEHSFTPPFYKLIPHGVASHAIVQELVLPVFAQVQSFLGFPVPRPAAPFTYTNQWGANIATLTMIALGALAASQRGRRRVLILAGLVASLVPMIVSLNRGMLLSLAVGILYVTLRFGLRGRVGALAAVIAVTALMVGVVVLTPLGHLVMQSFGSTHGHSNSTRLSLYQQASSGANASPLFGYGSPQQAVGQPQTPAIGTQGQLWMVLYSHGYLAATMFVGFFLIMLWQTRKAAGPAGIWLHAAVLVALSQIVVYGWLPAELQVVMVAAALAYRLSWPPPAVGPVAEGGPGESPPGGPGEPGPGGSGDRPGTGQRAEPAPVAP